MTAPAAVSHLNLGLVLAAVALFSPSAGAQQPPADAPAPTGQLTKKPKLKTYVEAAYPEEAVASGRTATVTLQLDIDAAGRVTSAIPQGPADPPFDAAAIKAALQLQFEPAEIDGVAAPVRLGFRYRFSLQKEPVKPKTYPLTGRIVERKSKAPVAGAMVSISSLSLSAQTDAQGRFDFVELPAGVFVVGVGAEGFLGMSIEQPIPVATNSPVIYELVKRPPKSDVHEEIVIRVPRVRRAIGSAAVGVDEAKSIPGVMGDALAVVQNLPGVARASAGSGEVVVWGSSPAETRIYIDDVPVPYLYHRGGLRSVMNDALVSSVELIPGGFGAAYGRSTGGLVRITTSPIPEEGLGGYAAADFIDASTALRYRQPGPNGSTFAAGGRFGYLDKLLPAVAPSVTTTVPLSSYWDYAAKYIQRQGDASYSVLMFGASDAVDRVISGRFTEAAQSERSATSFHRLAAQYQSEAKDGTTARVTTWVGVDDSALISRFGQASTEQTSKAWRAGTRAGYRFAIQQGVVAGVGADAEVSRLAAGRAGTLSLPAREGDRAIFGQPPAEQVASDTWQTHYLGLATYAELELSVGKLLTVTPGLRFEPTVYEANRSFPRGAGGVDVGFSYFELPLLPRLTVELRPSEAVTLNLSGGLYQQPPDPVDLSSVFGGTALESSRAVHAVLGGSVRPWQGASVEAALFAKQSTGLAARAGGETVAQARALVSTGEGRSYGGQLVVKPGSFRGLSGWVSYSLMRAERRDTEQSQWRLFDQDQTHVLVAVASYSPAPGWNLGLRVRGSTGYPRTPVTGAVYEARSNLFLPIRGENNSSRLPSFMQLDLHAEREARWRFGTWKLYADLLNVTNRRNAEEVVYNYDYSDRKFLTGLPLMLVFGGRVEF